MLYSMSNQTVTSSKFHSRIAHLNFILDICRKVLWQAPKQRCPDHPFLHSKKKPRKTHTHTKGKLLSLTQLVHFRINYWRMQNQTQPASLDPWMLWCSVDRFYILSEGGGRLIAFVVPPNWMHRVTWLFSERRETCEMPSLGWETRISNSLQTIVRSQL